MIFIYCNNFCYNFKYIFVLIYFLLNIIGKFVLFNIIILTNQMLKYLVCKDIYNCTGNIVVVSLNNAYLILDLFVFEFIISSKFICFLKFNVVYMLLHSVYHLLGFDHLYSNVFLYKFMISMIKFLVILFK